MIIPYLILVLYVVYYYSVGGSARSLRSNHVPLQPIMATKQIPEDLYRVHLPNDTLSITFENTVFSLIPKENANVSLGSVLKWRAR
jgi:hypothetical protein